MSFSAPLSAVGRKRRLPFSAVPLLAPYGGYAFLFFAPGGVEIEFSRSETVFRVFVSFFTRFVRFVHGFSHFFSWFLRFFALFQSRRFKMYYLAPCAVLAFSAIRLLAP